MHSEDYWPRVEDALRNQGPPEHNIFADLKESEIRRCVARSHLIGCATGDRVVTAGGPAHNLFVVLKGTLEVRHHGQLVNTLGPGDVFGEMAFLLDRPRQYDVYAATPDVQILTLSDGELRRLIAEEHALASKLLLNLSRILCERLMAMNAAVDCSLVFS
jgi:CRP-like cAMP-binding protein